MPKPFITFLLGILLIPFLASAQQQPNRIILLQGKLDSMAKVVPGLNEKVQLAITGATIRDYLNALARSNDININVDPTLNFTVNSTISNVSATNILLFLCQQYNLDIVSVGSILIIKPYKDPSLSVKPPPHIVNVKFNQLDNSLTLELNNDTLVNVARRITAISGRNIIVPAALQSKLVSGYIAAAPFDVALEKLAYANEIKMVKTADNFYLFQSLEEGEQLYVNGDRNTAVRRTFKPAAANAAGGSTGIFSRMVGGQKLLSADASNAAILDMVKQGSQEMNKSYAVYSDIKGTITLHATDLTYENFLTLLFRGTEYNFRQENGVYLIGDGRQEGLKAVKAVQLQNRAIDTVVAMIPADWKKAVEIKELREQNTILLTGPKTQVDEIESFVKQIDVLVPMVLIEITMFDVHKSRTTSTGLAAGVSDSVKTGGTLLPGTNFTFSANSINSFLSSISSFTSVNLGHVVPNFYVTLSALESTGNVDVHSIPKLATLNGHTATMSIGNTRYYSITTANTIPSAANLTTISGTTYTPTEANTTINIKPIVSGDDQVTLKISVEISDFTDNPASGPPPKSTSKFESSMRAHDGDMIVLGGIERTEIDDTVSGFPILDRIPILKYIFSNKSQTKSKVTTVLFIKPTIIR